MKVLSVLEKIRLCDPAPAAIIIHIDQSDGRLEAEVNERFPDVDILTSSLRRGPGGGRHRCLLACKTPFAVSFDDDSYPVDFDFFATVERLFLEYPRTALLQANIWNRNEPELPRATSLMPIPNYMGGGYAIRLDVYRKMRGLLDRPVNYGMEELDLSLQLFVSGYPMMRAGELRVFHDSDLKHHHSSEITSGSIMNVALYAFLHYPLVASGFGMLQLGNKVAYCLRRGRIDGIIPGLLRIPADCWRNRMYRKPVPWKTLQRYVRFCRTGHLPEAENA
jgi:hypothetical protein